MVKIFSRLRLKYIYLVFMLLAGSILTFLTPVYQIPDEPNHFARAWQISELVFISPTENREDGYTNLLSDIPAVFSDDYKVSYAQNIYSFDDIAKFISAPINFNDTVTKCINNTGVYSPAVYFPQALAAYLVRNFTSFSAGICFYMMRFAALLFVTLCIFLAIKILPEKNLLIFLISMMPMFLAESASIAADAVINGVCVLVSAYILSLARTQEKINSSQVIMLILAAVIIGQLKQVYGTIMLLYFIIPYERLGSKKKYIIFGITLLLICLVSSFSWLYLGVTRFNAAAGFNPSIYINPTEQMKFFLENPITVFKAFIASNIKLNVIFGTFIGVLGWLRIPMYIWFRFIYMAALIIGGLSGKLKISWRQRLIMITGCFMTLFAMDFMFYFTWNSPGALTCEGIQGRYFIPLAVMIFSVLSCLPRFKYEKAAALIMGSMSILVTLIKTYSYFY